MNRDQTSINELAQRYPKGMVAVARVRQIKPFGALLSFVDETPGIVRSRELSWDQNIDDPAAVLSEGQKVRVLVLEVDAHHQPPRLELSLRQVERDPWQNLSQRYHVGQKLRRKVNGLIRVGAFVELEPAVDGFLPLREISANPPEEIEQALWLGDTVDAVITRIDYAERQIGLSLRQHLAQLERRREQALQHQYVKPSRALSVPLRELIGTEQQFELIRFFTEQHPSPQQPASNGEEEVISLAQRLPRVLVVDNDPSFRSSLQRILVRNGHQAEACDSAERSLELCEEKAFDLVLLDYEFHPGKLDGLQTTEQLVKAHPHLPIVLVTGISWLPHQRNLGQQARHAGARGLLAKPLDFNRLQHALTAIADGNEDWTDANFSDALAPDAHALQQPTLSQEDLLYALNEALRDLQRATRAEACVLFHLHPSTRQVSVFAHQGAPLTRYDAAKYKLQASPVFEVIQSGAIIHEPNVAHHREKFQHLDILQFTACLGLPVKGFGAREYGLFLFHPQPAHFTDEHLQRTTDAAHFIGALFTRKEAERAIQQMQPFAFAGQLGAHLVHEINNQLSSILINTDMLATDTGLDEPAAQLGTGIEAFSHERSLARLAEPDRFRQLQTCVSELQKNAQAMRKITRLYLGMVGPEHRAPVSLNDIMQRAVSLLTPVAESFGVKILTEPEMNLPATLAVGVRIEQVFVNLMLNAIQQMHLSKGGGELSIKSQFTNQPGQLPLQVRFTDTGPGIHAQLHERIFDLGFTTRQEGGGFGLFITRGLIKSMGGAVSLEESAMLVGSTFLIELPLIVPFVSGGAND